MTKYEIIAMAKEAGFPPHIIAAGANRELARFAAMVEEKERDACAQVCDTTYYQFIGPEFGEVRHGIAACSAAIRARLEGKPCA